MSLYAKLLENKFSFISGENSLKEVYMKVKRKYPKLCKDSILCCDNCKKGNNSPEWKHTVRNVLQLLKKNKKVKNIKRGFWYF